MLQLRLSGFAKSQQSSAAVCLLSTLRDMGLVANTFHFQAVITSCGKAGEWEQALDLLTDMMASRVGADMVTYMSACKALEGQGKVDLALALLQGMRASGLPKEMLNERLATGWSGVPSRAQGRASDVRLATSVLCQPPNGGHIQPLT